MGRIFVGLCQVGAWGCFDEFNRLEERMLSAVSQQVQCIQEALREHSNPNFDKSKAPLLHATRNVGGMPLGTALIRSEGAFHSLPGLTVAGRVPMEGKPGHLRISSLHGLSQSSPARASPCPSHSVPV